MPCYLCCFFTFRTIRHGYRKRECRFTLRIRETPKRILLQTVNTQSVPVEMLYNAAFHQSLHCLLRKKDLQTNKIQYYF